MRLSKVLFVGPAALAAIMLWSNGALSQPEGGEGGKMDAMMGAWMKYAQPGKFHTHLEPFVGKWTQQVKWWMGPGGPPEVSTGICEYKWILGGRFLLQEVKEDTKAGMDHPPFEGFGLIGYDNFKKKYTSMWADNMTTAIMTALGTCDQSGKVFTMVGKHDDVFSGKPNQTFRTITRIVNKDKHIEQMYVTGPDGKEFKTLEIVYTRR